MSWISRISAHTGQRPIRWIRYKGKSIPILPRKGLGAKAKAPESDEKIDGQSFQDHQLDAWAHTIAERLSGGVYGAAAGGGAQRYGVELFPDLAVTVDLHQDTASLTRAGKYRTIRAAVREYAQALYPLASRSNVAIVGVNNWGTGRLSIRLGLVALTNSHGAAQAAAQETGLGGFGTILGSDYVPQNHEDHGQGHGEINGRSFRWAGLSFSSRLNIQNPDRQQEEPWASPDQPLFSFSPADGDQPPNELIQSLKERYGLSQPSSGSSGSDGQTSIDTTADEPEAEEPQEEGLGEYVERVLDIFHDEPLIIKLCSGDPNFEYEITRDEYAYGGVRIECRDEVGEMSRYLYRESGGDLVLYNYSLWSDKEKLSEKKGENPDYALKRFAESITVAQELGVDRIRCSAARSIDMNGYYTWFRYGYQAEFSSYEKDRLVSAMKMDDVNVSEELERHIRGSDDMLTLYKNAEAREFWKRYGWTKEAYFDPHGNSENMNALRNYLNERGLSVEGIN
jgi:hypothetical protein